MLSKLNLLLPLFYSKTQYRTLPMEQHKHFVEHDTILSPLSLCCCCLLSLSLCLLCLCVSAAVCCVCCLYGFLFNCGDLRSIAQNAIIYVKCILFCSLWLKLTRLSIRTSDEAKRKPYKSNSHVLYSDELEFHCNLPLSPRIISRANGNIYSISKL